MVTLERSRVGHPEYLLLYNNCRLLKGNLLAKLTDHLNLPITHNCYLVAKLHYVPNLLNVVWLDTSNFARTFCGQVPNL